MKGESTVGIIVLIIFLVSIGYIAINFKEVIEEYIRGASGKVVTEPVEATARSIREMYTSLQKTMDLVTNPWKYMYEIEEAKPSEEVIREQYGISISYLSPLSHAIFKCKNKNCSDIIIPDVYLVSYIRYNFPEWKRIRFSCNVSTTYDECFSVRHCNISKKEIKGVKGILAQQIKVTLEFNKNIPICHDCSITTNPKECINEPVRFKDYGFRAEVTLKANFNVEANTTFRSLVTTDTVLSEAISRKKSIYNVLNIDSTKYDVAYYTGLLDFPHVSISRLGRNYNYPIILFGENTESYDVLLFGIRELDNIKSINNLKVYIFTSKGIDLNYLNLENGKCENNYRHEFKIDDSKTLFSINCREQSSNLEGEKHYCDIKITKKFVDNYRRRDGDPLKFIIPICLRKKETFIGDYGELLVRAYINYTYEVSASSEIPYTPFYTEI